MMRPIAQLAGLALAGVVAIKLLGVLLFPLLGVFLGFLMWVAKIALIMALVWWGFHLFKKWNEGGKTSEA
jgi:hypothetical protein